MTSDDPRPGDFDGLLASIDPEYVQRRDGDPEARLRILVSVEGEDVRRLERRHVEERGYPELTDQAKRKILGENLARLHGIDVDAKKAELGVPG